MKTISIVIVILACLAILHADDVVHPGYLGCYHDNDAERDFELLVADGSPIMTIELCAGLCQNQNYSYAGLQHG